MDINNKKAQPGCLAIIIIIVIIAFVQTKLGCGESKETKNVNSTQTYIVNDNSAKVYSFSTCDEEKQFLNNLIKDLKDRNQNLKKSYSELKGDQMSWDIFISDYNKYTWTLNDNTRNLTFECIHSYLFANLKTAYGLIGLNYIHGPTKKAKDFEIKFKDISNQILKELQSNKPIK